MTTRRKSRQIFVGNVPIGGDAPIAKAVFLHSKHGTDSAWVARTMAGVMMGFIAPIIGAVLNVLREWQRDGSVPALRAELGVAGRADALRVLKSAMQAAARMRPMPQIIWRTAVKPHRLGTPGAGAIEIAPGDILVLGLVSGTQQSLADGQHDERLMFGGARERRPHPTHACPGYGAGIEAILGTLWALLTVPDTLRESSAPLSRRVSGTVSRAQSVPRIASIPAP